MTLPEIASLPEFFSGKMRPQKAVNTFMNTDRLFPIKPVPNGKQFTPLKYVDEPFPDIHFESNGRMCDLDDYLAVNRVAGLLIMKDGKVALENYELGFSPNDRWALCSVAKSIATTLVGAAIKDGAISSINDPVTKYIPELKGSGYEGVSVRHMLMMASGVEWDETYIDPASHRRRLLALTMEKGAGSTVAYMSKLPKATEPGLKAVYNTGESYLMGALLENAVGMSGAAYLSEKLWRPLGMEKPTSWWLEGDGGMILAGSGLNVCLRDMGRFGQFILNHGRIDDQQVVPDGWFQDAGAPLLEATQGYHYGYMWWVPDQTVPEHKGAFMAFGIYGQCMYVNPMHNILIVTMCARSKPSSLNRVELNDDAFFAAVVKALS